MDTTAVNAISIRIGEAFNAIADKLQAPAEHVYGILVRQAVLDGWTDLPFAALLAGVAVVCGVVMLIAWRSDSLDEEAKVGVLISVGIVWFFSCCSAISFLTTAILHIYNPEYYAIREILNAL